MGQQRTGLGQGRAGMAQKTAGMACRRGVAQMFHFEVSLIAEMTTITPCTSTFSLVIMITIPANISITMVTICLLNITTLLLRFILSVIEAWLLLTAPPKFINIIETLRSVITISLLTVTTSALCHIICVRIIECQSTGHR